MKNEPEKPQTGFPPKGAPDQITATTRCRAPMQSNAQGFSLLSVLFLSTIAAAAFVIMADFSRESDKIERARASGWHLVQVAKAARLYVRNNSILPPSGSSAPIGDLNADGIDDGTYANPALFGNGAGGLTPQEITIPELITAGLLPEGFKDTNSLNQTVKIIAANYPLNGDPLDPATMVSAYVFLIDSDKSNPGEMQYVADIAKENNFPISSPLFNTLGTPIDDCDADGQPDIVLWDSGCISLDQMDALVSAASSILPSPFPYKGSLIVPAWRSMPHDTRAVMRYRQPGEPNTNQMMTNLALGHDVTDATGACAKELSIQMANNAGGSVSMPTGLCAAQPDNATAATQREQDRRVDIINMPSIKVRRLVLSDQTTDDPGTVEVSYTVDGNGNHTRNPDGDTPDNGLRNPRLPPNVPEETLGVQGIFSSGKNLQVIASPGVTPAAYFANATGTKPGLVTVENNLIVGDGSPTTKETFTTKKESLFKHAITNSIDTALMTVGGGMAIDSIYIETNATTAANVSATDASVNGKLDAQALQANTANWSTLSMQTLLADTITGPSITSNSASAMLLTTNTLSLGKANLFSGGADTSVDIIYKTVCTGNVPNPPPDGC